MASNSQEFVPSISHILVRAKEMYGKKAYIHQYTNFGLEEDQIVDSFYKIQKVIDDYTIF